jgi:hypothetical protein
MTYRAAITLLAALAIGAGVAACGSSSSSSSSTAAGGGATVTAPTDAQVKARLNLVKCMRAHGINVPDSAATATAGAGAGAALRQLLTEYSQTQISTALMDCKAQAVAAIPALSLSASQIAQREQEALTYVKCLRAHGINVPDPVASGLRVGIVKALSNVDTASPAFQKANTACASLRPGRLAAG